MSPLLDPAHCSQSDEWSVGFPGAVCDHTVNFHRLALNNPSPTSLQGKDIILTNSHGTFTWNSSVNLYSTLLGIIGQRNNNIFHQIL